MKKKLLALIMTACMVTTMFTACGKADSPAASETEGQNTAENNTESGEKETIEFWDMIWGSDADAYEATVREICEQVGEEIGANVEVRFLPWDNFTQVYLTAVASGTAPDVGTTGTTLPSQVHMMGGTMNLNSILEDWKAENNPILDAIPQEAFDVQTFDGELVAMPFDVQPECITYNEAIFKECGITEEPTTFDEFLDVCRTIKEKRPDIIPFVAAAGDHEVHTLFTYFCMLNGTNVVTEDLKPNVSSPEVLHVCEFLKTMYDEGLIAESAASMTSGERDSTYLSCDDGKTWSKQLLLDERDGVSYPDVAQDDNGDIYIIYDYNRYKDMEILMAVIRETEDNGLEAKQLKVVVDKPH